MVKNKGLISYPTTNEEMVKNLAGRLKELGVAAWVFSGQYLGGGFLAGIESKINESDVFLFVLGDFK